MKSYFEIDMEQADWGEKPPKKKLTRRQLHDRYITWTVILTILMMWAVFNYFNPGLLK